MEDHEHAHEHEHKHEHEGNNGSYPWKDGHYLGEGSFSALEITGDQDILRGGMEMKIFFVPGDFGEADPEVGGGDLIKLSQAQVFYTVVW